MFSVHKGEVMVCSTDCLRFLLITMCTYTITGVYGHSYNNTASCLTSDFAANCQSESENAV